MPAAAAIAVGFLLVGVSLLAVGTTMDPLERDYESGAMFDYWAHDPETIVRFWAEAAMALGGSLAAAIALTWGLWLARSQHVSRRAQYVLRSGALIAVAASVAFLLWPIRNAVGEGNALQASYYDDTTFCVEPPVNAFCEGMFGEWSIEALTNRRRLAASLLGLVATSLLVVAVQSRRSPLRERPDPPVG